MSASGSTANLDRARYKEFPPGWGHLKIPVAPRQASLAGLCLYTACKPRALWAQRAAWLVLRVFGARGLPGRADPWSPPMASSTWAALQLAWRRDLGAFDGIAGYLRVQAERPGLALLLLDRGSPVAFLKLRRDGAGRLEHEAQVQSAVWHRRTELFTVPRPLTRGAVDDWSYFAVEPLTPRLHRPAASAPIDQIVAHVSSALSCIARPADVPSHWQPMHGDFTPWNLRQTHEGGLVLLDWEGAGWGPPGADSVLYQASAAALRGRTLAPNGHDEAVRFWQDRLHGYRGSHRDQRFASALGRTLASMRAAQPHVAAAVSR